MDAKCGKGMEMEAEREVIARIKVFGRELEKAKREVVEANMPMVRECARKFALVNGGCAPDLVVAGRKALEGVLDRFDPDSGVSFSVVARLHLNHVFEQRVAEENELSRAIA